MSDGHLIFDTKVDTTGAQTGMSQLKNLFKVGIAGYFIKQATDIGGMGIAFNAQMEQYQASFKVLLGDADKASKHINDLKQMAAKTPFEMGDLASASQTLLAFGDDVGSVQDHLKMLGDISLGNKEKFNSLSLAFGQVQSQGKLTGQDLLQMINAGFNPLKVISEETGESVASLKDKMAKGQITYEDVAHAMELATQKGGQFYKGMEEQSKTFSGKLSTLKDNVNQFLGRMTDPAFNFLGEHVLPKAIKGVDWLLNHIPLVQAVLTSVSTALTVGFAIHKFNAIKTAIMGIGTTIKTFIVANPWLLLAAAIAAVVVGLTVFIKSGGDVDKLGAKIEKFGEKIAKKAPKIAEKLAKIIPKIIKSITKALPSIIKAGVSVLKSLIKGITSALPALIDAGIMLILALIDGLVESMPILIDALPGIMEALIEGIIKALPLIIEAGVKLLEALIEGLVKALPLIVKMLPKIMAAIVEGLFALTGALITLGADLLSKLWDGISSWVGNLLTNIGNLAKELLNDLMTGLGSLHMIGIKWIISLWNGIAAWFSNLANNIYNGAVGLIDQIQSGLGSLYDVGANWIAGLWHGIKDNTGWLLDQVGGVGSKMLKKLKKVLRMNSPSKATIEIGEFFNGGTGIGLIRSSRKVIDIIRDQAKEMLKAFSIVESPEIKPVLGFPKIHRPGYNSDGIANAQSVVNNNINIYQPVKTPFEVARAIRKESISLGLAGA